MTQPIVRTRPDAGVSGRDVPLPHLSITATTVGAAQTFYTVPNKALMVKRLAVANRDASAVSLTLHSVPDGGSAGNDNVEIPAHSIPANTAVDLTDIIQGYYPNGTMLQVYASTTGVLVIHGWGEDRI